MADWGVFIKSQDGSLLVTPDTACYELLGSYGPTNRTGNVNRYSFPATSYPLIFIACGQNQAAGLLSVSVSGNNYVVEILATVSCPIYVFRTLEGTETGYGMATYDSEGKLIFASSRNVLNVRNAGAIREGASFPAATEADMVSFTCGAVRPASSFADRWELVEAGTISDTQYVCRSAFECRNIQTCGFFQVCGFEQVYDWSIPPFGGFVSQYVCRSEFQCRSETVCGTYETCGYETFYTNYYTTARVRRTTWSIDRGVARIGGSQVTFDWLRHKDGYYDRVLYYNSGSSSSYSMNGFAPIGYSPPPAWFGTNLNFVGELSRNNEFPYTTTRANDIPLTCLTSVRSNYD